MENANVNLEKYHYYKEKADHHMGKAHKYKGQSKSKYHIHYKHYKLFYAKMMYYAHKCGHHHHHHHEHEKVCETHTHYKHYYHHHHIDVHHHECKEHCGHHHHHGGK